MTAAGTPAAVMVMGLMAKLTKELVSLECLFFSFVIADSADMEY